MLKYSIAMAIRLVCIIAIVFVRGWWMIIPAVGAIFLPYFAVVIANASTPGRRPTVEGPGTVVRYSPPATGEAPETGEPPAPEGDT